MGQQLPQILGLVGGVTQGISSDVQNTFANVMNFAQRQEAMGWLNDIGPGSQVYQDLIQKSQAHIGDIAQNSQQAMGLYQDAVKRAGEGGIQERRDLNRQFDSLRGATEADLTERGLNATTVVPSVMGGIERNRADALGGLNSRLRSEQFGFDMGGLNLGQQLFSQGLNSTFALQQYPFQMQQDDIMRRLSLQSGFNNFGPDPGLTANVNSALGSLWAQPPQAQQPDTLTPALVGGGTAVASTAITAKIFLGCVDQETKITLADNSWKPLREVRKGMILLGGSGKARKVIGVDLGKQTQKGLHIRLVFDKTYLIISRDHLIHGRPADDWKVGSEVGGHILKRIELATPEVTGDILLEGGEGYIANGICVASMLAFEGVTERQLDEYHKVMFA